MVFWNQDMLGEAQVEEGEGDGEARYVEGVRRARGRVQLWGEKLA